MALANRFRKKQKTNKYNKIKPNQIKQNSNKKKQKKTKQQTKQNKTKQGGRGLCWAPIDGGAGQHLTVWLFGGDDGLIDQAGEMGADGAQVAAVGQPSVEGARDDLPLHRLAQDVQRLPATGLNQI